MQENTQIIARIQKLLALSRSSNEHEAASALAKAQALLAEHNLSMAEVQVRTGVKSAYIQEMYDLGSRDNWRRALLFSIAKHNFCEMVIMGAAFVSLIGEHDNIQVVQAMYTFVVPQLERLATAYYRVYQSNGGYVAVRTWKNNFFMGVLEVIRQRLAGEKQAFEVASNACRSLVVVKDRDLLEAVQRFYPHRSVRRVTYRSASDGYARGVEAGEQVRFRNEVSDPRSGRS